MAPIWASRVSSLLFSDGTRQVRSSAEKKSPFLRRDATNASADCFVTPFAYPEEEMQSWRVSDQVGNTRNNWAELIEPVPDDKPKPKKAAKRAKPKKESPRQGLFD